jgi:hypothetical protein
MANSWRWVVFFPPNIILGAAKQRDMGNKKRETVGVALRPFSLIFCFLALFWKIFTNTSLEVSFQNIDPEVVAIGAEVAHLSAMVIGAVSLTWLLAWRGRGMSSAPIVTALSSGQWAPHGVALCSWDGHIVFKTLALNYHVLDTLKCYHETDI